jgi:putative ATP-dependent endonuclease of OLD family
VNGTDFLPFRRLVSEKGLSIANVVVTDGDPAKSKEGEIHRGVVRGIKLIQNESVRELAAKLKSEKKYGEARKVLATEGIFVGATTLETDLVSNMFDEMKESFSDLHRAETSRKRFNASIDAYAASKDQVAADDIIRRIDQIGKGRFAQRLAEKIRGQQPPKYIKSAIEFIAKAVQEAHA